MSLLQNSNAISAAGGYDITDSLRIRQSASGYLERTPTTSGSTTTATWSFWIKLADISGTTNTCIFEQGATANNRVSIYYRPNLGTYNYTFQFFYAVGASYTQIIPNAKFRDPSAWYHVVVVLDTTNATANDRMRMYVNGEQITSFELDNRSSVTQNQTTQLNTTDTVRIGSSSFSVANPLDAYLSEFNFVDGQALTASDFGETNADGVWSPKKYTGTYGTNGFYLNFSDGTSTTTLGYDYSGNSNNWTTNNVSLTAGSTYDLMSDTPSLADEDTSNFATLNPNDKKSTLTLSEGNLRATGANASYNNAYSTMQVPKDTKIYFEVTVVNSLAGGNNLAFYLDSVVDWSRVGNNAGSWGLDVGVASTYYTSLNGTSSNTGISISNGHVTQMAIDQASGKIWLGINNTWLSSGNPSTGANPIGTISTTADYYIRALCYNSGSIAFNFGQRPFAYTPPTGYKKLNTYNLPDSSITDGSQYMNPVTWTGDGSTTRDITGFGFTPDLVWTKKRSATGNNYLFDSIRGNNKVLISDLTNAELVPSSFTGGGPNGIIEDGFDIISGTSNADNINANGATFVGWGWRGSDSTAVSNTDGTITSTVSANTTSGFSVVTYTGNGSSGTVGHGLGSAPTVYIIKNRSASANWIYFTTQIDGSVDFLSLNTTGAKFNASEPAPTSSIFTLGSSATTVNASGNNYVAYCFAEVEGFSKFGSYTGNGSTDGTFVYTGFRPAFILYKRSDTTANWRIQDTARDTNNDGGSIELFPHLSNAESSSARFDILSNGFKAITTSADTNASGGTYIYMAFAENPFKNSLGR